MVKGRVASPKWLFLVTIQIEKDQHILIEQSAHLVLLKIAYVAQYEVTIVGIKFYCNRLQGLHCYCTLYKHISSYLANYLQLLCITIVIVYP